LKYNFFNIFITNHFETEDYYFQCVFDSSKNNIPNSCDTITHIFETKKFKTIEKSIFFDGINDNILKDISLILTIAQGTHIFCPEQNIGRISERKKDFNLFLSDEIGGFLDESLKHLTKFDKETVGILKIAFLMFYEAKHFLFYDGLRIILMMNCFEFLIGSIYRKDEGFYGRELKMQQTFNYIVQKFDYQKFIGHSLKNKPIKNKATHNKISSFNVQFREMRNWIAHGKQYQKPVFKNSPSDFEFTFLFRLESFIRIILIDMIYGKDYKRKVEVLYYIILENNVCPTLTPEFAKLKFVNK
jgi:hypothetical protein